MSSSINSFQDATNILNNLKKDTLLLEINDTSIQTLLSLINDKIQNYIVNNINKLSNEFSNYNILDELPIGTTLMWNNNTLPNNTKQNTKWVWCDGYNNTPDLRLKFPVGNEINKIGAITSLDTSDIDGIIKKENLLKHSHDITISHGGKHKHTLNEYYYIWNARAKYSSGSPDPKNPNGTIALNNQGTGEGKYMPEKHGQHFHTISNSGNHSHDISSGKTGNNKIFYPRFSYVNFITKINIIN